ncbi:MAG: S8 family serine peptidase [Elusimicrobiota bacterium]
MKNFKLTNLGKKRAAVWGALFFFFSILNLQAEKIEPQLSLKLQQAAAEQPVTVIVRFKSKNVKSYLQRKMAKAKITKKQIFKEMRQESSARGSSLKMFLNSNNLKSRNFWLINGMTVTASPKVIQEIALRDDVEMVCENVKLSIPPVEISAEAEDTGAVSWGIEKIGAEKVWQVYEVNGNKVRVGHLDTGVDITHPDLVGKLAAWAEFDSSGGRVFDSAPHDSGSHGTHTAGTIVGGSNGGSAIGVAPGAQLLSAMVLNENSGTMSQVIAGMEWVIDPDNNPDTDDGAQVVNMSLGSTGTEGLLVEPTENMIAAGVFPAFSIGNSGLATTSSPGNIPSAFGVGATDSNDSAAGFSSGGEVTWNTAPYFGTYLKPDISAPGVSVKSSVPGGKYSWYSGTSMAAPHISGVAALILQANPLLSVEEVKNVLITTAQDFGAAGQDNRYGWGRVNALACITQILSSGKLVGTVGNGLVNLPAKVRLVEKNLAITAVNGEYSFSLLPGLYTLEVSAFGYQTVTSGQIEIKDKQTAAKNFILPSLPSGTVEGTVKNSQTGELLEANIAVLNTEAVPLVSNPQTGIFSLSLPEGSYQIKVSKIGYLTQVKGLSVEVGKKNVELFALPSLPSVLLVDDDGGARWGDYEAYYKSALEDLGVQYDYHEIVSKGSPAYEKLIQYTAVIWFTGNTWQSTLTEQDQSELKNYLNNGGHLFLTGEDIGWDLRNSNFTQTYLHTVFKQDDTNIYQLFGQNGSILENRSLNIKGGNGANNQRYPSEIDALTPAKLILKYQDLTSNSSVETKNAGLEAAQVGPVKMPEIGTAGIVSSGGAGLTVETEKYKLVFFSFGFEGINDRNDRKAVLARALNYLDVPLSLYVGFAGYTADEISGLSAGDGVVSPGEEAALTIKLKNLGKQTVSGITASLTVNDPYLKIVSNHLLNFNDIAGGKTAGSSNHFDFQVEANCPDYRFIPFKLEVQDNAGHRWVENWGLRVITLPEPANNLAALTQPDGSIRLEWQASVSTGINSYNVYSDNAEGNIDYTQSLGSAPASECSWNSGVLKNKTTYKFGLRTVSSYGYEEKNTTLTVSVKAEKLSLAEAILLNPKPGRSLRGNAVSLAASGNEEAVGAQFIYRSLSDKNWKNIDEIDRQPVNSSFGKLFSAYWNTAEVEAGEYALAAAGIDQAGNQDLSPAYIKVTVNDNKVVDIIEDGNQKTDPTVNHTRLEKVYANSDNDILMADGTKISIKSGTVLHDTIIQIKKLGLTEMKLVCPPQDSNLKSSGAYYDFKFFDGTSVFPKSILLTIPYQDKENDGIIDGTNIPEKDLKLYYRNGMQWEEVSKYNSSAKTNVSAPYSIIDAQKKCVYAEINHFSSFSLMGYLTAGSLDKVNIYPNPYKPSLGHRNIYFDNLTDKVTIRIFTIAGRLVREISEGTNGQRIVWDVKNDAGEDAASGVYFYLVTDEHNNKTTGKIAIIR